MHPRLVSSVIFPFSATVSHLLKALTRTVFFAGLVLCANSHAAESEIGQDLERLRFEWIEESEDFASIAVISLYQDPLGFIWVGTRDGLYRYDAQRFVEYRKEDGNRHGLPDNWIDRFFEDSSGEFWISMRRGVCRYDRERDRFIEYELEYYEGSVKGFHQSSDGRFVLLTESDGFYEFSEEDQKFQHIAQIGDGSAKRLLYDPKFGYIVGGTFGVRVFDEGFQLKDSFDEPVKFEGAENAFVGSLAIAEDGKLWLGTDRTGAWSLDLETGETLRLPGDDPNEVFVGDIYRDRVGNMFVGSTAGLRVFPNGGAASYVYRWDEYDPNTIQTGTAYAMMTDRQGNFWVGTSRGGLSVARNAKAFHSLNRSREGTFGLSKQKVTAMTFDSDGDFWVGFHNEGLDRIDFGAGTRTFFDPMKEGETPVGRGTIWAIEEDNEGSIWLASNWSGLRRFDPKTNNFEVFAPEAGDPNSIRGTDVRRILKDEAGNFWLGLHGVGVDYYDRETGRFVAYNRLTRHWVEDLELDSEGGLWVASSDGLSYLVNGGSEFVDFDSDPEDPNSLSDRHVMCLYFDGNETLWAGTLNGLCTLKIGETNFRRYGFEEGLPSLSIRSVVSSASGEIWVATAGGLARFDSEKDRFESFDRSDGFATNEFVNRATLRDDSGVLYFGSEKGIVYFDPNDISLNEQAPDVVITEILEGNVSLMISEDDGSILTKNPVVLDRIEFPAEKRSFGFRFAALNYIGSEKNEFAYKLEGFDQNWIFNGTRSDCSYTNIDPGKYTFRVRASNNDGVWNEAGASLEVIVLPFFWETNWFLALIVGMAVLAVVILFRIRVQGMARQKAVLLDTVSERTKDLQDAVIELELQKQQIEDQNLELIDHRENLEELIGQRTEELEEARDRAEEADRLKSAFLENISHEVRTPMNAIQGMLHLIRFGDEKEHEAEYYEIIDQNCDSLVSLIDDIIELSRLEAEGFEAMKQDVMLKPLFQKCQADLRTQLLALGKTSISVQLYTDENAADHGMIRSDSARLEQILANLLDNAVKFTESGSIQFGYRPDPKSADFVELFVSDTGIGIPEAKLGEIFNRFRKLLGSREKLYSGMGLGLAIVKRVVELSGGEISVISKEGEGTEFVVRLPIR